MSASPEGKLANNHAPVSLKGTLALPFTKVASALPFTVDHHQRIRATVEHGAMSKKMREELRKTATRSSDEEQRAAHYWTDAARRTPSYHSKPILEDCEQHGHRRGHRSYPEIQAYPHLHHPRAHPEAPPLPLLAHAQLYPALHHLGRTHYGYC